METKLNEYHIYAIENNINNSKYVGCTKLTLEKRMGEHKRDGKRDRAKNRKLYKLMNDIGLENFTIKEVETVFTSNKEIAFEREIYWIEKLDSVENGYNESYGGAGKYLYNKDLKNKMYIRYLEIKSLIAVAKEFKCDIDTVRSALFENGIDSEQIIKNQKRNSRNRSAKSVICFDLNGVLIKRFNAIVDGIRYINSIRDENHAISENATGHISSVCNGNRGTAYGFTWKWAD